MKEITGMQSAYNEARERNLHGITNMNIASSLVIEMVDEIESLRAQLEAQSGEAVVFSCHGAHSPAYGCNKPGDQSGTYYTSPPAAKVPEGWSITEQSEGGSIILTQKQGDWRMLYRKDGTTRKERVSHAFLKAMLSAQEGEK